MRLSYVLLRVSEIEAAVVFWRDRVGLETNWSDGEFAFFPVGDLHLGLHQPETFAPPVSDTEVVFEVDDVRVVVSEMKDRGVPFEVEPRPVTSDGSRSLLSAHFRDPDGNLASVTGWVEEGDQPQTR